jgi:DNA repair exonuclease SbcCD nuclease subunit
MPAGNRVRGEEVIFSSIFPPGEGTLTHEIRVLHTADVHLDCLFAGLPYERRVQRREEVFQGLRRVTELAEQHRADVLLVVGDLFEPEFLSRETVARVAALFRSLEASGTRVVLVPGNHDRLDDRRSPYAEELLPPGVHVFRGEDFTSCRPVEGLTIWAMPFVDAARRRRALRGFAGRFSRSPDEGFRIVAHHGAYSGFTVPEGEYAPVLPEDLADTDADYVALGHHHSFRDCSPPKGPPTFYPGSPVRLDWTDLAERRALLVRLEPATRTVRVEPLALPDRPFLVVEFNPAEGPLEELFAELERLGDGRALLRVILEGTVPEDRAVVPGRVEAACRDRFFHVRVDDRTRLAGADRPRSTIASLFLARLQARSAPPELVELARRFGLAALEGENFR